MRTIGWRSVRRRCHEETRNIVERDRSRVTIRRCATRTEGLAVDEGEKYLARSGSPFLFLFLFLFYPR